MSSRVIIFCDEKNNIQIVGKWFSGEGGYNYRAYSNLSAYWSIHR